MEELTKAGNRGWRRWRPRRALLAILTILLLGCAGSPTARLKEIALLVESARSAGAERWAPDLLVEASSLLRAAEEEILEQRQRRWAVRSYRVARLLLEDAERQAEAARELARQASIAAKDRASEAMVAAGRAVRKVRAVERAMPVGADTADDRAGLGRDLADLEKLLERAEEQFAQGAFAEAAADADAVHERGLRIAETAERSLEHRPLGDPRRSAAE